MYNVQHALVLVRNRTRLLLSKPKANLRGDASGTLPDCRPHTQGSCVY